MTSSHAQWAAAGYRLSAAMGSPRADDPVIVHDAGFTEIAPGSFTASAKFTPSA
jgi:peptidyl-tRNA hydrolase